MKQENDTKREKLKQRLAMAALILIAVFIITGCLCMIFGNTQLMMASLFCLIFVPIIIYCFILVYDMTHGRSKREREEYLSEQEADTEDSE